MGGGVLSTPSLKTASPYEGTPQNLIQLLRIQYTPQNSIQLGTVTDQVVSSM